MKSCKVIVMKILNKFQINIYIIYILGDSRFGRRMRISFWEKPKLDIKNREIVLQ